MKTKYSVGDVIKDTQGFGTVTFIDIYFSRAKDEVVYEVKGSCDDIYLAREVDLESI